MALAPGSDNTSSVTRRSTWWLLQELYRPLRAPPEWIRRQGAFIKTGKGREQFTVGRQSPPAATSITSPGRRLLIATSPAHRYAGAWRFLVSAPSTRYALTRAAGGPAFQSFTNQKQRNTIAASAVAPINSAPIAATSLTFQWRSNCLI